MRANKLRGTATRQRNCGAVHLFAAVPHNSLWGAGGWKIYKKYGTTLPMSRLGEVTQKTRLPCKPTGIRSEDFTKHFELQTGAKAAL